jgi:hypothetical protein
MAKAILRPIRPQLGLVQRPFEFVRIIHGGQFALNPTQTAGKSLFLSLLCLLAAIPTLAFALRSMRSLRLNSH